MAATVPRTRGSLARQEADQRYHQQAGIQFTRAVRLHERAEFRVEAIAADLGMDGVAQLLPTVERPFETESLDGLDAAVEGDPGHHLANG